MFLFLNTCLSGFVTFSAAQYKISPKNYTGYYISKSKFQNEKFTISTLAAPVVFIRDRGFVGYEMYIGGSKVCINNDFQLVESNEVCNVWNARRDEDWVIICTKFYDNVMTKSGIRDYCLTIRKENKLFPSGDYIFDLSIEPETSKKNGQLFKIMEY